VEQLGTRDLQTLLDFLRETYAWQNRNGFVRYVTSRLSTIVPSESTSYNEVNLQLQRNTALVDPPDAFTFPDHQRIFQRHIPEHPLIAHYQRTGDARAHKISDFLSQPQFHRLGLYNEFFRRVNVEHLIAFTLHLDRARLTGIALTRRGPDFSERDRLCLNLLRPHLIQAHRNVEAVTRIHRQLELANHHLEAVDQGVIVLTPLGRVRMMTARARQSLMEFFGSSSGHAHHLPEDLRRWVSQQEAVLASRDHVPRAREPLVVRRAGRRLVVRLCHTADERILLLESHSTDPQPRALECLGLSRREAEVLVWIAEGKTNREIGTILGTSNRTVGKHVERIFQKLGVETRTAAAALGIQASCGQIASDNFRVNFGTDLRPH